MIDGWTPPSGTVAEQAVAWLSEIKATDEAHRKEFEAWYSEDLAHADAFDALLDVWDKTALLGKTDATRARQLGRRKHSSWPGSFLAAAAALLLITAAGLMMMRTHLPLTGQGVPTKIASVIGELRTVTLADGSRVTLDTDTVLRTEMTDVERRIWLDHGRARFDVAHDSARPFVVAADSGTVTAHGTVFDVAFENGNVIVGLLKGVVEVRRAATVATSGIRLAPGQSAQYSATSAVSAPKRMNPADAAWTTGMLSFADARLADAVVAANRYSHTKILLGDDVTRRLRVTGRFAAKDATVLAKSLAATFQLTVVQDGQGNVTLSQPGPRS